MKTRILMVSSAVLGMAIACSAPPSEPAAVNEQGVTTGDDEDTNGEAKKGCAHSICAAGGALVAACDPCATILCGADPYCCGAAWDETCVGEVASICGQSCTAPPKVDKDDASSCAHPICGTGPALVSGCDPCVTALCAQDPYCCGVMWDATCVGEVGSICSKKCN